MVVYLVWATCPDTSNSKFTLLVSFIIALVPLSVCAKCLVTPICIWSMSANKCNSKHGIWLCVLLGILFASRFDMISFFSRRHSLHFQLLLMLLLLLCCTTLRSVTFSWFYFMHLPHLFFFLFFSSFFSFSLAPPSFAAERSFHVIICVRYQCGAHFVIHFYLINCIKNCKSTFFFRVCVCDVYAFIVVFCFSISIRNTKMAVVVSRCHHLPYRHYTPNQWMEFYFFHFIFVAVFFCFLSSAVYARVIETCVARR